MSHGLERGFLGFVVISIAMYYIIINTTTIVTITMTNYYHQDKVYPQNITITMNNLVERLAMGEQSSPGGRRA